MNEIRIANWFSSIVRWTLGGFFMVLAYNNDDAKILYFFGAVIIATGFFKPRRCTMGACGTEFTSANEKNSHNDAIVFEEVK